MASKELIEKVSSIVRGTSLSSERNAAYRNFECEEKAEEILSTIFAALLTECHITGNAHILKWLTDVSPLGDQSDG